MEPLSVRRVIDMEPRDADIFPTIPERTALKADSDSIQIGIMLDGICYSGFLSALLLCIKSLPSGVVSLLQMLYIYA